MKALPDLLSGESPLPSSQRAIFSLCPHIVEGGRALSGVSFIGTLIPFRRVSLSQHKHLQEAPLPNISTLMITLQPMNWGGGDINIQTTATGTWEWHITLLPQHLVDA